MMLQALMVRSLMLVLKQRKNNMILMMLVIW